MKTGTFLKAILFTIMVTVFLFPNYAFAGQKVYTNSIGMEFVLIPPGSFYMGSCKESAASIAALKEKNKKRKFLGQTPLGTACLSGARSYDDASDNETPEHKISISKAFYMGKYEVTAGQFKKYIADKGREDLLSDDFIKVNSHGDRAAVSYVSWDDAQGFISWLSAKESGKHYGLPSEAQWEYACRAGSTTRYFFGNNKSNLENYAWYSKNTYDKGAGYAHLVGQKHANSWGLYDMHGNTSEWCQDRYGMNYYKSSAFTDPSGPSSGSNRVLRGGSWGSFGSSCRSASRGGNSADGRIGDGGFRVVLSPGQ